MTWTKILKKIVNVTFLVIVVTIMVLRKTALRFFKKSSSLCAKMLNLFFSPFFFRHRRHTTPWKGKATQKCQHTPFFLICFYSLSAFIFHSVFPVFFFSPFRHSLTMQLCHDQSLSFQYVSVSEEKEMVLRRTSVFYTVQSLACRNTHYSQSLAFL